MHTKSLVKTEKAVAAAGPYSQATHTEQFVFVSGQSPIDPVSGLMPDGIEHQTQQALANLAAVLEAGGACSVSVLKTTVYLRDMSDFGVMNEVYTEFFKESLPARSIVEVARLRKNALIEIEAVALRFKQYSRASLIGSFSF